MRVALAIGVGDRGHWDIEINAYESESGEPGRLSNGEFSSNRSLTKTPHNRVWIDRESVNLF